MAAPIIVGLAGVAGRAVAKKVATETAKKAAKKTKATTKSSDKIELSEYGKKYYTDSLTKQEAKDLHKWRMKNDLDYKNEMSIKKIKSKNKGK
jgi:hypothetical protein